MLETRTIPPVTARAAAVVYSSALFSTGPGTRGEKGSPAARAGAQDPYTTNTKAVSTPADSAPAVAPPGRIRSHAAIDSCSPALMRSQSNPNPFSIPIRDEPSKLAAIAPAIRTGRSPTLAGIGAERPSRSVRKGRSGRSGASCGGQAGARRQELKKGEPRPV